MYTPPFPWPTRACQKMKSPEVFALTMALLIKKSRNDGWGPNSFHPRGFANSLLITVTHVSTTVIFSCRLCRAGTLLSWQPFIWQQELHNAICALPSPKLPLQTSQALNTGWGRRVVFKKHKMATCHLQDIKIEGKSKGFSYEIKSIRYTFFSSTPF